MKEVYIYNFTHNYKEEYAGTTTHAFDKPLMKYEYDDLLVDSHINAFNIKCNVFYPDDDLKFLYKLIRGGVECTFIEIREEDEEEAESRGFEKGEETICYGYEQIQVNSPKELKDKELLHYYFPRADWSNY